VNRTVLGQFPVGVTDGTMIASVICSVSLDHTECAEGEILRRQKNVFEGYIFVSKLVF
jgi:hypothetical protein